MSAHPLAQANIEFMNQGIDLLDMITDEQYSLTRPPVFKSPIGCHLRHCLDHVDLFAANWRTGQVDYDARDRGTRIETDRLAARDEMNRLIPLLAEIGKRDMVRALRVKMDCGECNPGGEVTWAESSVMRELQFLVSHTVHHYALISMILQMEGITPDESFGYAPATLKFLNASS